MIVRVRGLLPRGNDQPYEDTILLHFMRGINIIERFVIKYEVLLQTSFLNHPPEHPLPCPGPFDGLEDYGPRYLGIHHEDVVARMQRSSVAVVLWGLGAGAFPSKSRFQVSSRLIGGCAKDSMCTGGAQQG